MPDSNVDNALSVALVAPVQWLSAARVPYALVGGVAVALQAAPRFTKDIDVVVWTDDARCSATSTASCEIADPADSRGPHSEARSP